MKQIVLASGNEGKLRELRQTLAEKKLELLAQTEFDIPEAPEDGLSFVENAIIKARHASRLTGLPALADDSGLEVDALNGEPGIFSARYYSWYTGDEPDHDSMDEANNELLLENLEQVPEDERGARFQCAIALVRFPSDPMPLICQGTWEGRILFEARGENGFGYDPLFYVPGEDCSSAELDPEVKNRLSHRARAIQLLLARWPG